MIEDPIVAEVRAVREQLAAKFDFDIDRIMADVRQRQRQFGDRLASFGKEAAEAFAAEAKENDPAALRTCS
jgi:hypothetical protein